MTEAPTEQQTPLMPHEGEQPTTATPRRGGCLKYVIGAFGCLLILLLIPVLGIVFGLTTVAGITQGVQNIFSGAAPRSAVASVIPSQTIVTGIEPLGQLVSVSVQLAQADINVGIAQGSGNVCGFSASHVAQGTIEAGIDFTQVGEDDVSYNTSTNTYTITLPAPQLTSCRVDYIRQYDRSTTLCVVDWDEARLIANYTSLIGFRDSAVEGGILSRAEQQSQVVIDAFVQNLTGANVEIVFAEPTGIEPASCQPEIPTGWTVDPATNTWTRPGQ
jgi:hypothetical protein